MDLPQYGLPQAEKELLLRAELDRLTEHHRAHCPEYRRLLTIFGSARGTGIAGVPWLPVSVFKTHRLLSVPESEVFKTMTSSGTTGQRVSRIVLDRATAQRQAQALVAIMATVLGPDRLPMLIVDSPAVVGDRRQMSARGAGVLGMAALGRHHTYALDTDMRVDVTAIRRFLERFGDRPFLMFGFTYMVWRHLVTELGAQADLSRGVLVHSGGWKALQAQAVDNPTFKRVLRERFGLTRVHNFYGMVEQVGSVFLEGDDGYLHAPNFADVLVRDPVTWEPAPNGTVGVLEVVSALPTSYPGHAILTEDLGVVHDAGDPATGWGGTRLSVVGRLPRVELRGCGDTHAVNTGAAA
ncbi:LuxE/PaaK family acyltransferase [Virgisporangium aliadipatigenens]|uniref:LuxE/PaaK family acyltransferase n=1 Tax=Virgisporangium aliadipatigenens TaxID=741659 RepID=UPI003570EDA1